MPLVKIFARANLTKPVPLAAIQSSLCKIWGTKPNTTKLILQRVEDWTDESFQEDVYVDIRAYGTLLWIWPGVWVDNRVCCILHKNSQPKY